MTPGALAVAVLAALAAIPLLVSLGYHAARLVDRRRGPDALERRARQALVDALTDPRPGRWQ